jgi:hypothetical protein
MQRSNFSRLHWNGFDLLLHPETQEVPRSSGISTSMPRARAFYYALKREDVIVGQRAGPASLLATSHHGVQRDCAISGAGGERTATAETELEAGKRYIVAADPGAVDTIVSAFQGG